jgi:ElaB/YqjD/DUF883 family membrane-anchored ribosome-binding protein
MATEGKTPFPNSSDIAAGTVPPASTGGDPASPSSAFVQRVVQSAQAGADKIAQTAKPAVERVKTAVTDQADQWTSLGQEWSNSLRTSVRHQPLAAVAVGVAIGWLLGRLTDEH